MTYTKKERAQILEALESAVGGVWDGHSNTAGHEFICHAINMGCEGSQLAKKMIADRLSFDGDRYNTVQCWLTKKGYLHSGDYLDRPTRIKVQAYRIAWLEELIREFSE